MFAVRKRSSDNASSGASLAYYYHLGSILAYLSSQRMLVVAQIQIINSSQRTLVVAQIEIINITLHLRGSQKEWWIGHNSKMIIITMHLRVSGIMFRLIGHQAKGKQHSRIT